MPLTSLPQRERPWSVAVQLAYQDLFQIYETTSSYIESESLELFRLQHYGESIITRAYPLLLLLSTSADQESLPAQWIESVADDFTELYTLVEDRTRVANEESGPAIVNPENVHSIRTGTRGQPKKMVNPHVLHKAFQSDLKKIPITVLARILGIDRKTLRNCIKESNLNTRYDEMRDDDLDKLVKLYYEQNPEGGRVYVIGRLRAAHGLRIQRQRVVDSMNQVNLLGQGLKQRVAKKKEHCSYHVPRPNSLWHIDGHHKLISWGIVIHGIADGYSRKITRLRASTDNTAATVLDMFIDAILEHGIPSRVRGDRGGENRDVSILMILLCGLHRASFMWGSSVFNTRIERVWVEVGRRFVRRWRAFFTCLERCHLLNRKSVHHRWLLHRLFLAEINDDCDAFISEWNSHPITGAGHGHSPNELAFLGELQHGAYANDCDDLTPEEINAFFGFTPDGRPLDELDSNLGSQEDAVSEYSSDELDEGFDSGLDSETEDSCDRTEHNNIEGVDSNIRHDAVPVPKSNCPFNEQQLSLFEQGLKLLIESEDLPQGYGVTDNEMGPNGYEEQEEITVGLQKNGVAIEIPRRVWLPRVKRWAQGLFVMNTILSLSA